MNKSQEGGASSSSKRARDEVEQVLYDCAWSDAVVAVDSIQAGHRVVTHLLSGQRARLPEGTWVLVFDNGTGVVSKVAGPGPDEQVLLLDDLFTHKVVLNGDGDAFITTTKPAAKPAMPMPRHLARHREATASITSEHTIAFAEVPVFVFAATRKGEQRVF